MGDNRGPKALLIMWVMTSLTWAFVGLRFLTRIFVVRIVGADDYVYVLSAVLMLLYNVFLQISLQHGFGQNVMSLEVDQVAKAIKTEMIGQTFAVIGMAVAKVSMGLFLLRLVAVRWHKIAIWTMIIALMSVSVLTAIMFWVQCLPSKGIWDPRERPNSKCNIQITPFAVTLGVACILADLFFAVFPMIFVWQLNMKRREKITIAGSMSLGIIAGVAGIVRTYEVASGFTQNYTQDTVPLIIWSSVEIAVTLICIGIPTTMPLWRRVLGLGNSSADRNYQQYERHEGNSSSNTGAFQLDAVQRHNGKPPAYVRGASKLGLHCTMTTDVTATVNNNSDEDMLRGVNRDAPGLGESTSNGSTLTAVHVKDEVRVEWNR